jgi:hypothetical protein
MDASDFAANIAQAWCLTSEVIRSQSRSSSNDPINDAAVNAHRQFEMTKKQNVCDAEDQCKYAIVAEKVEVAADDGPARLATYSSDLGVRFAVKPSTWWPSKASNEPSGNLSITAQSAR